LEERHLDNRRNSHLHPHRMGNEEQQPISMKVLFP
jgi:hypothetical protein